MVYRISIFTNALISLVVIGLSIVATLKGRSADPATVSLLFFLFFGYGTFLAFDLICYRILKINKEKLALTGGIKRSGKIVFPISIIALLSVLLITTGTAYSYFSNISSFPERQRPFFIAFIVIQLLASATYLFTAVGYFKSLKENKTILSKYIDEIGTSV